MEPYYAGILSLLPPVIAITLALITKEVISSLLDVDYGKKTENHGK